MTAFVFYVDHIVPKMEQDGTFTVTQVVREAVVEIKMPTRFAEILGRHLVHAVAEVQKNPTRAIFGPSSFAKDLPPNNPSGQAESHGVG